MQSEFVIWVNAEVRRPEPSEQLLFTSREGGAQLAVMMSECP